MTQLHLDILTPVKKVVSVECDAVLIPGIKGQMGTLPEHAELVTLLSVGVVSFKSFGTEQKFAVSGGFVKINQNKITLLADEALSSRDLNKQALESEKKEMEKKLISADVGIEEREKLFLERDWLNARLAIV